MSIYAVNGKEPIAAWIPSLDTAGNGTTTLTDLVGSNNGTLTNMDAATDWVSDTSNGGVRALDFDGVNDVVSVGNTIGLFGTGDWTISLWVKTSDPSGVIFSRRDSSASPTKGWVIYTTSSKARVIAQETTIVFATTVANVSDGAWHHIVAYRAGTSIGIVMDASAPVNATLGSGSIDSLDSATICQFGPQYNQIASGGAACAIDDIRIFNQALDASDIAYLYNNGNGRGRTPSIYAVNGKDPIAAWIPSRDTAGNGTTTLTDLVGSNDGTLTNMDAATDWVADTDAGGIRALDFDGVNDYVDCGDVDLFSFTDGANDLPFSISAHIYMRSKDRFRIVTKDNAGAAREYLFTTTAGNRLALILWYIGANGIGRDCSVVLPLNTWQHVVATYDGSATASGIKIYLEGSRADDTTLTFGTYVKQVNLSTPLQIGAGATRFANGRIDDIRIFNTALDAADIAYLYNSGNGRGIIVESPSIPSAIYHPFASLKHPLTF